MLRILAFALPAVLVIAASGCGGGSLFPTPTPVSVQISRSTATVLQGASQSFTATVSGTSNTAVTWSVQKGAAGGTITAAGSYTAPATSGSFVADATAGLHRRGNPLTFNDLLTLQTFVVLSCANLVLGLSSFRSVSMRDEESI